jgi:hypothetical protein
MTEFLSEYVSPDGVRTATIHLGQLGYIIDLWENGHFVQTRYLHEHTEQYAKDCAENWIEGIIK